MKYSEQYYETYRGLPERLAEHYPNKRFDNHCYLRIGLDNTFGAKWDTRLKRPAYKNLEPKDLKTLLELLHRYEHDEDLLMEHNDKSLSWRSKK